MLKKSAKLKKRYILVYTTHDSFKSELKKLYLLRKTYLQYSNSNLRVIITPILNYIIVKCNLIQFQYIKLIINLTPLSKSILSSGVIRKLMETCKRLNI